MPNAGYIDPSESSNSNLEQPQDLKYSFFNVAEFDQLMKAELENIPGNDIIALTNIN